MSYSPVLRAAQVQTEPQVIDNAHAFPVAEVVEEPDLAADLVEELQQQWPDTEPEVIESAVSDAIDQLMADSPEDELDPLDLGEFEVAEEPLTAEAEDPVEEEEEDLAPAPLITPPPPAPVVDPEIVLAPARAEAAQLVSAARREADQVLADADNRAAEIEKAAYERGYQEGVLAGKGGGEQHAIELIRQVTAIVDQARDVHDTMLQGAEAEMVALCLEISRKIIQAELRTNPDVVKSVIGAAIQKINGSPRVTIKVHPSQVELVKEHWDRSFGPHYRETEWIVEGDQAVMPGGCVLNTKYGSLDAQIGAQFAEVQKTFALLLGTQS